MEGDAGAGQLQHAEIIGAVADGNGVVGVDAERFGDVEQGVNLGLLAEDRFGDDAGELAIFLDQDVGAVFVEAEDGGDAAGEDGETAGDERGVATVCGHRVDQFLAAGGEGDALGDHVVHDVDGQALEQGNALTKGRFEFDFAVHGACGDGGDEVLQANFGSEFINAFLADHGRVHVGDQELLAACLGLLEDDIDRSAIHGGGQRRHGFGRIRAVLQRDIAGDPVGEPVEAGGGNRGRGLFTERGDEYRILRIGDERGDESHGDNLVSEYDAILITGPTASGKSALALDWARRVDGVVVNADSMQVYNTLRVVTARPSVADMGGVEHRLYGHVPAITTYSTGAWLRAVEAEIAAIRAAGKVPVLVGGTGLYFKALTGGLSEMPEVPEELRLALRARLAKEGPESLHTMLAVRDPEGAAALQPGDGQRILRALEVLMASGKPIAHFQALSGPAIIDASKARKIVVLPERDILRSRIDRRFASMMDEGAAEEVEGLLALAPPPDVPAMKAIGVPQIAAMLKGEMSRADVIEQASAATRQYAKRQMTWFRNQMDESWERIAP